MEIKLNLDWLQENCKRIYYFGLGFIQVVLDDYNRLHFYTDKLPTVTEGIHNHRYNFKSKILKGKFTNIIFDVIQGDDHILENESCSKERKLENIVAINCGIKPRETNVYVAGDEYYMPYNTFHDVIAIDGTITHLERSKIILDYAQVITPNTGIKVCPFSINVPDEKLWDIIKNMIN